MMDQTIVVEHSGYSPTFVISLDSYERGNLLWLLALIGYSNGDTPDVVPVGGVPPFTFINNGDWVGQLANKLRSQRMHNYYPVLGANGNMEDLQKRMDEWVESKILSMNAHDLAKIMEKKNG